MFEDFPHIIVLIWFRIFLPSPLYMFHLTFKNLVVVYIFPPFFLPVCDSYQTYKLNVSVSRGQFIKHMEQNFWFQTKYVFIFRDLYFFLYEDDHPCTSPWELFCPYHLLLLHPSPGERIHHTSILALWSASAQVPRQTDFFQGTNWRQLLPRHQSRGITVITTHVLQQNARTKHYH